MKKIVVLVVVAFISALIVSSCNNKTCPAYTKTETVQNNQVG
jgi:ABC-type Fe3+-citrate transport system substrate-binding protein